ncbi:MAG: murein biosynthesis integral membrane protein MurJ [Candidatus Nanopelagicales bacterium]|nr:murein biosynthesis integral membrane protein MurJ [Candidatus Nanopelagicales bacterium]
MTNGESGAVLRSGALMAAGTVLSRLTGVLRDIALAAALGFGMLADTYALGNALPNIVYILIIGGALNAVFVPQLVRRMQRDDDGGDEYAHRLLTLTGLALLVLSIAAVLAAPWLVRLYATSDYQAAELDLAVVFARYCLPQIFFYGLYTMLSQVLNARMRFGPPMFTPIINNIVMIATAVGFVWLVGTDLTVGSISATQTAVLGIATTTGIALQALALIPFVRAAGYSWRPRFDFRGWGLGKAGSLAGWTIGLVLVNQLGFLVISRLATTANVLAAQAGTVPEGLATYQRAYLVFMLPHSVITISLVTALLPRMSKAAAANDLRRVGADVAGGLRLVGALIIPASLFLLVFGPAIGTVLFDFGAGAGGAAEYTGLVVSAFGIGLLPFSAFYVLLRGWYAVEDTRTPFLITVIYNVIAIPLTIAVFMLVPVEGKVISLAVSYGVAYWLVIVVAWWRLNRRLGGLDSTRTAFGLVRITAAALVSVAVGLGVAWPIGKFVGSADQSGSAWFALDYWPSFFALISGVAAMALAYFGCARLFRVTEVQDVISTLVPRFAGSRKGTSGP